MKEKIIKVSILDLISTNPKSVNPVFELLKQKIKNDCFEIVAWTTDVKDGSKLYKIKYDPTYSISTTYPHY